MNDADKGINSWKRNIVNKQLKMIEPTPVLQTLATQDRDDASRRQAREESGLCPSCGQQLYSLKPTGESSWCCWRTKLPNSRAATGQHVRKIPLTIPRLVERGQCLQCSDGTMASLNDISSVGSAAAPFFVGEGPAHHFEHPLAPLHSQNDQKSTKTVAIKPRSCRISSNIDSSGGDLSSVSCHLPSSSKAHHINGGGGGGGELTSVSCHLPSSSRSQTLDSSTKSDLKAPPSPVSFSSSLSSLPSLTPSPLGSTGGTSTARHKLALTRHRSMPQLPLDTAVYRGEFNERGEKHGQGKMTWSNGDVYTGAFVNDQRQGHGTLVFAYGSKDQGEYVGGWLDNVMHGQGTRRYPNGDVYVGEYRQGKRHGEGRFYYANGDMYWGEWCNNNMHGPGRYYYASGQRFEGFFLNNKRTGKGKLQRTDGSLEIFQYMNDQRVGQGVRWSTDRTKAWRLWVHSSRLSERGSAPAYETKKITTAEAVSLVNEIEQAAATSIEELLTSHFVN